VIARLMAWCVPDEALRRRRVPPLVDHVRAGVGAVVVSSVPLRYGYGRVEVPKAWTVGREG
jgi:hypothetical protein